MSGLSGDYAGEIRRAVEVAARAELPGVAVQLWQAYGQGKVTDAEAEALSGLIEARQRPGQDRRELPRAGDAASLATAPAVKRWGSRPRGDASMERRRRWAASGRLPPQLAAKFTLAEQAVLAVVAAEVVKRGACRMPHDRTAAVAGVSRSTVRATLRRARDLGLVTIEEQRLTPWRSLPSIVRIVSAEWSAWNRLVRRPDRPDGRVSDPQPFSAAVGERKANTRRPSTSCDKKISAPSGPQTGGATARRFQRFKSI